MALCSTVEGYDGNGMCGRTCSSLGAISGCCSTGSIHDSSAISPKEEIITSASTTELINDPGFHHDLRSTLDFYNVNQDYKLTQLDKTAETGTLKCAVAIPSDNGESSSFLNLEFPERKTFVTGEMPFMILATILILLFTATVLLYANWSLIKQKRLLATNIEFFNNMAHEFRTPLTSVGLATNMLRKNSNDTKNDQLIEIIQRENSKLLSQVERVLHLAQIENGDYHLQKEEILLHDFLQSVISEMKMQIDERNANIIISNIPVNLSIHADKIHLATVFRNLIDNALKYSEEHPDIRISATENDNGIFITIEDNGIGIPTENKQIIFEKFQRAQQSDVHERKGFGLGLAYVKKMMELHKGFVRVNSELNKGSRFELFLPSMK
jgi:two-component system phosphate regulon sensor histidine kinase PhoR